MIAPAVLISAAGLLILGVSNRYGRINDRIRNFNELLPDATSAQAEALREDRALMLERARRSWLALTLLHGAVLSFVAESFLLGVGAALSLPLAPLGDIVLVLGVVLFGAASIALVTEATIAFESTRREIIRTDNQIKARLTSN